MCTAITYKTKNHYFGRNLDLEYSYHETITITPRNYPFKFRNRKTLNQHYAMIGMAYVQDDYPLYYEATNEKGLSMAGLNFPDNAYYPNYDETKDNVSPFEFIPWILSQCERVEDAEQLLASINLYHENYSDELPLSPLHWIISDEHCSIIVEPLKEGLKIYENPVGVLTNNPTFDYHLFNLNNYIHLNKAQPNNTFSDWLALKPYSRGMGAMGLPGDASSMSRFVRAAFIKLNSISNDSEAESVSQFFHILKAVEMPKGSVELADDVYEYTIYSSCCNTTKGIYYYTTYDHHQICAVHMHHENLNSNQLITYPLLKEDEILHQN